jgi:hypothetical protein
MEVEEKNTKERCKKYHTTLKDQTYASWTLKKKKRCKPKA